MRLRALIAAVPLAVLMAFLSFLLPLIPFAQAPAECLVNADFSDAHTAYGVAPGWHSLHGGSGASSRWSPAPGGDSGGSARGGATVLLTSVSRVDSGEATYAGLYQSVFLLPGADYRVVLRGRLDGGGAFGDGGCLGCKVQWAFVAGDEELPTAEGAWMDVPLRPSDGAGWGTFHHGADVATSAEHVTLFVRVLREVTLPGTWVALTLDEVGLQGPCSRR